MTINHIELIDGFIYMRIITFEQDRSKIIDIVNSGEFLFRMFRREELCSFL